MINRFVFNYFIFLLSSRECRFQNGDRICSTPIVIALKFNMCIFASDFTAVVLVQTKAFVASVIFNYRSQFFVPKSSKFEVKQAIKRSVFYFF